VWSSHAFALATDPTTTDGLAGLAQYGVLGIVCFALFVYAKQSIKRETDRSDRAESRRDELQKYIQDEFLPNQLKSQYLHQQTADILSESLKQITELKVERDYEARRANRAEAEHKRA
jgi:hypothetical protein